MRFDRARTGDAGGAAESGRIEPRTADARGYPPPIFDGEALCRIDAGRVIDRIALGDRASNVEFAQSPYHATRRGAADLPNPAGTPQAVPIHELNKIGVRLLHQQCSA